MRFEGRRYAVLVALPVAIEPRDALDLAAHILGEGLAALAGETTLDTAFAAQKLAFGVDPPRPYGPCVDVRLGPWTLIGAASSTDPALARAMLWDRVALALTEATRKVSRVRDVLEQHHVTWVVKM